MLFGVVEVVGDSRMLISNSVVICYCLSIFLSFPRFANKQDLPHAMTVDEVTDKLELRDLQRRAWHVEPCCAMSGDGLYEGLEWLSAAKKGDWTHGHDIEPE